MLYMSHLLSLTKINSEADPITDTIDIPNAFNKFVI